MKNNPNTSSIQIASEDKVKKFYVTGKLNYKTNGLIEKEWWF